MISIKLVDNVGVARGEIELSAEKLGVTEAELREFLAQRMYLLDHGSDTRRSWALYVDHED